MSNTKEKPTTVGPPPSRPIIGVLCITAKWFWYDALLRSPQSPGHPGQTMIIKFRRFVSSWLQRSQTLDFRLKIFEGGLINICTPSDKSLLLFNRRARSFTDGDDETPDYRTIPMESQERAHDYLWSSLSLETAIFVNVQRCTHINCSSSIYYHLLSTALLCGLKQR